MFEQTDERTCERARRGDNASWNLLVSKYQRLVYSIPLRIGLTQEDAADVFQNTFLALHRELDRIDARALPRWLAVVASRESYRLKRVQTSRATTSIDTLSEVIALEEDASDEQAVRALQAETVRKALESLQDRCRELLTWLYLKDMSYEEICQGLGIPIGAIGPTRARCLDKLRKGLDPELFS